MDNEKKVDMQDLIERGKSKGSLSNNDIMEAIDFSDYDIDQLEKLYETLESNGIEVTSYINPAEFEEIENDVEQLESAEDMEKMLAQEGLAIDLLEELPDGAAHLEGRLLAVQVEGEVVANELDVGEVPGHGDADAAAGGDDQAPSAR